MGATDTIPGSGAGSDAFVKGVQVGLVAYGVTHLVIAAVALPLAWGDSTGGQADQQGAVVQLAQQPFGDVLLWVVVVGMASLVVWQPARRSGDIARTTGPSGW